MTAICLTGLLAACAGRDEQPSGESLLVLEPGGVAELLTIETGSSQSLPITPDTFGKLYMSWSPDGSTLAFVRDGDLWTYDEEDGLENLTDTPDRVEGLPVWSHDGKHIAFASREWLPDEEPDRLQDLPGTLTTVNNDGTGYRPVGNEAMLRPPSWSVDDEHIAYASNGEVRVYNLSNEAESSFGPADLGLADAVYVDAVSWSPVEDELAVFFSDSDVSPTREELVSSVVPTTSQGYAIVDLLEGRADVIMRYEAPFLPGPPAQWSPDGSQILVAMTTSPKFQNPSGLWIANVSTSVIEQADNIEPYQARWSPSGNMIAYIDNGSHDVRLLSTEDLQLIEPLVVTEDAEGIAWRPNAR